MLDIDHLIKKFERFTIGDISMKIEDSEYHILLGESGAGKSVLMELIAGIIYPDSGSISLHGKDITKLPTGKRRIGLVFQQPAIFPHYTVSENISYPIQHIRKADKKRKAEELAEMMGISHLLHQKTTKLSGGELQRISLARAFAADPLILLLDEPLSAVDTSMRADIRGLLRDINKKGMPVLHVTHDFEEAIALGNKISIIEQGQIVQTGTAQDVIENPRSIFTAGFTGERNFFKARIEGHNAIIQSKEKTSIIIRLGDLFPVTEANILVRSSSVTIALHEPDMSNMNNFKGILTAINPKKEGYQLCIDAGINLYASVTDDSFNRMQLTLGQMLWVTFKASAVEVII
jgi:ABC-type Fe3+/spermidine/putrescine transport system ATPase subunit